MTLPLLTRVLLRAWSRRGGDRSGLRRSTRSARSSAWSLASLVLLPLLGLKGLAVFAGEVDIGIGIAAAARRHGGRARVVGVAIASVGAAVAIGMRHTARSRGAHPGRVPRQCADHGGRRHAAVLRRWPHRDRVGQRVTHGGYLVARPPTARRTPRSTPSCARRARDTTVRRHARGDQITQLLLGIIPLAYHPAAVTRGRDRPRLRHDQSHPAGVAGPRRGGHHRDRAEDDRGGAVLLASQSAHLRGPALAPRGGRCQGVLRGLQSAVGRDRLGAVESLGEWCLRTLHRGVLPAHSGQLAPRRRLRPVAADLRAR